MILGIIVGIFLNIFTYDVSADDSIVINLFSIVSDLFIPHFSLAALSVNGIDALLLDVLNVKTMTSFILVKNFFGLRFVKVFNMK